MYRLTSWIWKRRFRKKVIFNPPFDPQIFLKNVKKIVVVSSPSALASFNKHFECSEAILNPSIELEDIQELANDINDAVVLGIGAGKVMDATKKLGFLSSSRTILIPTCLSTTAWLNSGSALRKDGKLDMSSGRIDKVYIYPKIIQSAPPYLNYGGIADIFCSYNALLDWKQDHIKNGKRMPSKTFDLFGDFLNRYYLMLQSGPTMNSNFILKEVQMFNEAFEMCWGLRSGRPLEGSEHYLYYALDEQQKRSIQENTAELFMGNHGSFIALTTIICLRIREQMNQENPLINSDDLITLYDQLGIHYRLNDIGFTSNIFLEILDSIVDWLKNCDLSTQYCLWNELEENSFHVDKIKLLDGLEIK